ncbi:hypothetical protein BRADI_5g12160v3 [Brachypodium distachyon]|uniref:Response regulatory domain-containing protein n=1 Tax=Brachypodium distachyon TaxID=15368 RepID=A0A0Q3H401_BRADI|nr:hypothetical protein BRADI_5g12160v3 [Brachypodium distachyon]
MAAAGDEIWAGMRVLAIDKDRVCLKILEATLHRCNYNNVTSVMDAKTALQRLREAKDPFDLVISELHMPDIDAFKLLRHIAVELGIPVIVLSAYEDTETVMKGLSSGACCYLAKPASTEKLKNIWQHVLRRKGEARNHDNSDNDDDHNVQSGIAQAEQGAKTPNKNSTRNRNNAGDDYHEKNKENTGKKPRVTWTTELHHKFLEAFNRLGDKAVPKRICEMMNVDYISRHNVASHLQKYRIYLQKQSDPSARASMKWNSYSNMSNLESFKHYPASSIFASSSSNNHFATQPIQLGSTLKDVLPPLPSVTSRKTEASANTLRCILLKTNEGTACSHLDYSFVNMPNDKMLEPVNQLPMQPLELVNQSSILMNAPATYVSGALGDASKFPDLFGNFDNSWQTSLGPSLANIPKMNQLISFVGDSSCQIPMAQNELQNPMAAFISNTTPMGGLNEQMTPFNIGSNTSSVEMSNGNFAPGSSSSIILRNIHTDNSATMTRMLNGLSNNYALPNIQAESSVVSTQKLNGGHDVGFLPVQEDTAGQEGLDDQLNDNTEFPLDDILAMDDQVIKDFS